MSIASVLSHNDCYNLNIEHSNIADYNNVPLQWIELVESWTWIYVHHAGSNSQFLVLVQAWLKLNQIYHKDMALVKGVYLICLNIQSYCSY